MPVPRPAPPSGSAPVEGELPSGCPGCGSVLAPPPGSPDADHGASAACARLFEETLRGLRDDASADPQAAESVALADAAYAAQHPDPADPDRLRHALETLVERLGDGVDPGLAVEPPRTWQMTLADVAADMDVVDLPTLVESWAQAVSEDWSRAARP